MTSRWVASLAALVCWLFSEHALGQSVIIRCNVRGDDVAMETATRLRGELLAMGVDVGAPRVVARKERSVAQAPPHLFRDADAVMDVSATSEQLVIELWARDGSHEFARWVTVTQPRRSDDAPEKLALRAAEALHSRLVEADLLPARSAAGGDAADARGANSESSYPMPDVAASRTKLSNDGVLDASVRPVDTSVQSAPERSSSRAMPGSVIQDVAPTDTAPSDDAALAPEPWSSSLQRPTIAVGGAVVAATDGLTASVLPFARLTWPVGESFAPYLTVAALGSTGRATTSDGQARVSWSYGVAGVSYFYDALEVVMPYVSAGLGATYVSVDGRAVEPHEGQTNARWLATAELGVGALLPVSARYYLTIGGQLQVTAPSLVIVVVDDAVAVAGRPNWAGTLAAGVRL